MAVLQIICPFGQIEQEEYGISVMVYDSMSFFAPFLL